MNLVRSFVVDALPARVGQALCSEAFNIEAEREREEVLSSEYIVVESNPDRLVFELRSTEYQRTKTGRIDRRGTVQSATRHEWDPRQLTLRWTYQGVGSKLITLVGVYRLSPATSGTQVVHEITIEVHIPLLGPIIARFLAGQFDTAADRFQRLLTRHASARA